MLVIVYVTRQNCVPNASRLLGHQSTGGLAIADDDRYRRFFKETSAVAAILDRDGNIEELNDLASRISGPRAEIGAGQRLWNLPIWRDNARNILRKGIDAAGTGKEWRRKLPARTVDEVDVILDVVIKPLREPDEGAGRLILDARPIEEDESIPLADLADLAAHDFNNMLAGIAGNLELVARQERDEAANKRLRRALRVVFRGQALTSLMDVFARKDRAVGPVDYAAELQGSLELCRDGLESDTALTVDIQPDLWLCRADREYLSAALLHLIIHVHDAAPRDGRISIRALNLAAADGGRARSAFLAKGDYVLTEFAVEAASAKDGTGRPATTVRRDANIGFGLRIVRLFARESGGDVTIGDPEQPSVVARLYLPRA